MRLFANGQADIADCGYLQVYATNLSPVLINKSLRILAGNEICSLKKIINIFKYYVFIKFLIILYHSIKIYQKNNINILILFICNIKSTVVLENNYLIYIN